MMGDRDVAGAVGVLSERAFRSKTVEEDHIDLAAAAQRFDDEAANVAEKISRAVALGRVGEWSDQKGPERERDPDAGDNKDDDVHSLVGLRVKKSNGCHADGGKHPEKNPECPSER